MTAFLTDWLNLLLRWAHIIVGIAWIGASFHFVWLDFSLRKRERMNEGVFGTSWMVHGGGFYHVEKYQVAPPALPEDLHWFKWEAYLTWLSGFLLLIVQYYWHAETYLIDPAVRPLSQGAAIGLSLFSLALGWAIYDGLCRSPLGRHTGWLALCVFVLIVGAAFAFAQLFSGRGAMIHVGAFIGTIMAANVFMVIIPNQRRLVAQLMRGETPEARLGRIGKQRSLHNNYLTLPVILTMVSNHYGFLTGHPHAWLAIALILILGAMVRHVINRADAGEAFARYAWALPIAALALVLAIFVTAPSQAPASAEASTVSDARALAIVATRCAVCHAARPSQAGLARPPKGVRLDSMEAMRAQAAAIERQAVQSKAMPPANQTGITDAERAELGEWLRGQK